MIHPEIPGDQRRRDPQRALDEAVALARALPGLEVVGSQTVRVARPRPGQLFGTGQVESLGRSLAAAEVELVIVDGAVSPVQQRNLEAAWSVKLLDRTSLILEIFSDRARTKEGTLQVEMAALTYQRTRLVRAWTHLERQRGALGFVGGPGETQIEADRRAIDEALVRMRRQLDKVVKTRDLHRASRAKVPFPLIALVGYTNAGKSTLFNSLSGASVIAEDMLFATLDPTLRSVPLPSGADAIFSDTVGFVSDLPTQLVAAFRATLEEVRAADLICHVRDVSHPEAEEQAREVGEVLEQLGVADRPLLEVWNKADLLDAEARATMEKLAARRDDAVLVSARDGSGLDGLLEVVERRVEADRVAATLRLDYADGRSRAWLHEQGIVKGEIETEDGYRIDVSWTARQAHDFRALLSDGG